MPNEPPLRESLFSTNHELCQAVKKYCGYNKDTIACWQCDPQEAEAFAQTYGYPINKWDISALEGFSFVFIYTSSVNEDISSWNVSKATTMCAMFSGAKAFNQDLSSWYMRNVTNMAPCFSMPHPSTRIYLAGTFQMPLEWI
jgi:surface protein